MAPYEPPLKPRDKLPVIENRVLIFRILRMVLPYRGTVALAMMLAVLVSAFGVASIAPIIPIVNVMLSPEKEVVRLEEIKEREGEREQKFEAQKDLARGRVDQLEDIAKDLETRFPMVGTAKAYVKLKKEELRADLHEYLLDKKQQAIQWVVAGLLLLVVLKAILSYIQKYLMTRVMYQVIRHLKVELYRASLELDFAALQTRTSGNLMSRLAGDVEKVRVILKSTLTQSLQQPFELVFLLAFLLFLSPRVTLITAIALPLVLAPVSIISRHLKKLSKRDAEEDAYLLDVMQETLQGMQIVKAFGSEKHEARRFKDVARAQVRRQLRRQRLALAAPHVTDVLTMAAMGAVLIAGGYIVLDAQELNAGEFTAYLVALTRFYKPIKTMSEAWVKMQRGLAGAERIFEIIDAKPTVVEKPDAIVLPPLADRIALEDVVFAYDTKRETVLNGLTMEVPKGRCCALVGPSGSGKSTVTKLIPRFYDPLSGRITIDGIDLRDVTFASLRGQIAIVTQETILFDSTIYENIAYGKQGCAREEVEAAARAANAHDFIMDLPMGYETRLGERGGQLSGGQRQRLAIARALLRDCPILILDEATSALDNESEAIVQEALERLMQGRTVLMIAHRLSTVQNADCIVVIDEGRAVEQGTHEELLERRGKYYELWHMAGRRENATADFFRDPSKSAKSEPLGRDTPPGTPMLGEPAPG